MLQLSYMPLSNIFLVYMFINLGSLKVTFSFVPSVPLGWDLLPMKRYLISSAMGSMTKSNAWLYVMLTVKKLYAVDATFCTLLIGSLGTGIEYIHDTFVLATW